MKLSIAQFGTSNQNRNIILGGVIALAIATAACSAQSEPKVEAAHPAQPQLKTASLQTVTPVTLPAAKADAKPIDKSQAQTALKYRVFKSRDYGVSFEYPWQYSFANAKTVSLNETLQPKADGFDGQVTLARIDVPKGFYPDTDFESGYLALSLNSDLEQKDCLSVLGKDAKTQLAKINNADFAWTEDDQSGKGSSSRLRHYVTYVNDTCYEIELGVKTNNETGLEREVNADQVMQKLEGMLRTVKFNGLVTKPAAPEVESKIEQPKIEGQK